MLTNDDSIAQRGNGVLESLKIQDFMRCRYSTNTKHEYTLNKVKIPLKSTVCTLRCCDTSSAHQLDRIFTRNNHGVIVPSRTCLCHVSCSLSTCKPKAMWWVYEKSLLFQGMSEQRLASDEWRTRP